MENITLDPEYENLIIEVNKLKEKVAEKIAERDSLSFHIVPDIRYEYMATIGTVEDEAFIANLKLLKLNRKIELCKEKKKRKKTINEKEIDRQINLEFGDIEYEYNEMQDNFFYEFEDEFEEKITEELFNLLNILYKNLIKKLSPLINFNNTRLDNQLYELLEKAYREFDLNMMSKLQIICEQVKSESTFLIGDLKTLERTKSIYLDLIEENEYIISHIKDSEDYKKKEILDDENLIQETKEKLQKEIEAIEKETKIAKKELKKYL